MSYFGVNKVIFALKNVILSRFWVKTCHFKSFWSKKVDFGHFLVIFGYFRTFS